MGAHAACRWFAGKGDVWRLLQDIGDAIDGRSWPEDQAVEVRCIPACPGLRLCRRGLSANGHAVQAIFSRASLRHVLPE